MYDDAQCSVANIRSDGNIRYYEYENDKFEYLSEYKSPDPQRGLAFMPRRGINVSPPPRVTVFLLDADPAYKVHENEIMRAYKTVNDAYIEPISFTVPRRAETFQADIFPPAVGNKPAVTAQEWLQGKTAVPAKIDLESIYEGQAPKEVPSDFKPTPRPEPVATPKAAPTPREEPKREEPKPSPVLRSPPPTVKEQKGSIAAMANRYQDNEEADDGEEDDDSSFEEIAKPPQRALQQPAPVENKPAFPSKVQTTPAAAPSPSVSSPIKTPVASSSGAAGAGGAESSLDHIKQLIENQTKLISAQNDKIGQLVVEVDSLKKKVGSGSQDQSERIRQLELELEEARG